VQQYRRQTTGGVLLLGVVLLASVLVGSTEKTRGPDTSWETTVEKNHPLVGKIWDVSAGTFIDPATLSQRLVPGRFVLLGEKHDNADHHRLQAWVLRELVSQGRRPAVGFEMFDMDQSPALERHLRAAPTDVAGLAEAVNWGQSGWPDWALYQPIAEAALDAGLPIAATNLPRSTTQAVAREGVSVLDPVFVERYGLAVPPSPEMHTAMANEMRESHCGHVSEAVVASMVHVQRARDAHMADSIMAAAKGDGTVLIAGAGHVRKDRGVPVYVAAVAPGATIVSLAFLEVKEGETEPAAYTGEFGAGKAPFDYLWFTPRVDNLDPCEKFGEQLEHLRKQP
jgi:uncharacterized iron-regulated protein